LKFIPIVIYSLSLSLLYMTSLQGSYLIGSDIHSEYYIAKRMMSGWDFNYPHLYAASLSTSIVAPWLSRMMHIDLVWIFKAVYPVMFAFVPVILWYAYRKMIGNWRASFAVLFFIIMPTFFLELPQIPKQMLAEVFLALIALAMVSDWKLKYRMLCIGVCLPLTIVLHWSVGLVSLAFLTCLVIVLLVTKPIKWELLKDRRLHLGILSVIVVVFIAGAGVWGNRIASGLPMKGFSVAIGIVSNVVTHEQTSDYTDGKVPWKMFKQPTQGEPVMRAATGGDFAEVTIWGKLFRVIQYITQLLVLSGSIYLLFRHNEYKFSTEFIICIGAAYGLLLCCAVIPSFSYLLNLTRFYHLTLFFLAPMFVLGVDAICREQRLTKV